MRSILDASVLDWLNARSNLDQLSRRGLRVGVVRGVFHPCAFSVAPPSGLANVSLRMWARWRLPAHVRARLTIERGFKFPDWRIEWPFDRAQRHQRDAPATIAFGFDQVVTGIERLSDCRVCLWLARRRHRRAAGPHDRIPSIAFQPISFAQLGLSGFPDQDGFAVVARVQAVRLADAFRLRLAVAARQRNLNDAWGHRAMIAPNRPGEKPLRVEDPDQPRATCSSSAT
ncbi:hypothetical protein ACVWZ3_008106 [Bradyrhizobium sp. i1.3.6]